MKVVTVGLEKNVCAFLTSKNIVNEPAAKDGFELADWLAVESAYQAAIVNLDLGFEANFCREIRQKRIATPVIGIASPNNVDWSERRASFLELGGDDLLTSPPNGRELVASLYATSRRVNSQVLTAVVVLYYRHFVLKVDAIDLSTALNGRKMFLTSKEQSILGILASAPGRTISKQHFLNDLYVNGDEEPESRIIDAFISKIRRKLKLRQPGAESMIDTVWGRGYRLLGETCPPLENE